LKKKDLVVTRFFSLKVSRKNSFSKKKNSCPKNKFLVARKNILGCRPILGIIILELRMSFSG